MTTGVSGGSRTSSRPNVVLIMADDMGFSDLGCYGSEIRTPHLDALAASGVRMSQFYNTARCSPARASLLTGLHPHQTGIGVLTHDDGPLGYPGTLNDRCVTLAEVLKGVGYDTAMFGKWHLTGALSAPNGAWPTQRGFDTFFGIIAGATSYYEPITLTRQETTGLELEDGAYLTTVLGDEAADYITQRDRDETTPFFCYLAFTAPHFPLHAPQDVTDSYAGVFDAGWDALRRQRYERLIAAGLIDGAWPLSERDEDVVAWDEVADKDWQVARMQVYAAQVQLMDEAVGRVVAALEATDQLSNTLIMFLSDNGGSAEEVPPGWIESRPKRPNYAPATTRDGRPVRCGNDPAVVPGAVDTMTSYGRPWANLSNTPFREYKIWVHEGGISTPFIAHWPDGGLRTGVCHSPHQLPDVMSTVVDATSAAYPTHRHGGAIPPPEGTSMLDAWRGASASSRPLFFEHLGNCAIRQERFKLVCKHGHPWELYDLARDRTELNDLASDDQPRVRRMADQWQQWAERCGVKPWDQVRSTQPSPILIDSDYRSSRLQPL